jgi:hypothetical protein
MMLVCATTDGDCFLDLAALHERTEDPELLPCMQV